VLYSHQQNDQQVTSVKTFFNHLQAANHSGLVPYNPELLDKLSPSISISKQQGRRVQTPVVKKWSAGA
jgi:hypothetical protein